jgi:hypothetical protein
MSDFDDERQQGRPRRAAPDGRVYVHSRCGGQTHVSGGDYTHICDPFWPCTGTYCCTCSTFVPLNSVSWADTGETITAYRSRMRAETPGPVLAWRYGLGLLPGALLGVAIGLLIALLARVSQARMTGFAIVGGIVGALLLYVIGTVILNRAFDVDYRRKR